MEFSEIAKTLIKLKDKDLEFREKLIRNQELGNGYHSEMERIHQENTMVLDDIINTIGYPTVKKVGLKASEAAWLIIQHSIGQPPFMLRVLKLLEQEVEDSAGNPVHLAYLTDRIAVLQDIPQKYGTQFHWDDKQ